jgi:hypothetical protein
MGLQSVWINAINKGTSLVPLKHLVESFAISFFHQYLCNNLYFLSFNAIKETKKFALVHSVAITLIYSKKSPFEFEFGHPQKCMSTLKH